jgi:CRP-like cAMP-binding protein
MIVDLTYFITLLKGDLVISGALAFLAGMASVMVYARTKSTLAGRRYRADEAVVEAVVLEYTRRLRDYDKVIADLRAKVDIIEVRSHPPQAMPSQFQQMSHQPQPHVAPMSEPVAVTQHAHAAVEKEGNNGTTDYILKLLAENPRTSREVQLAVGRTREHTARLMKKLHDSGLVSRDINAKPFRYNITDAGRERLKERVAPAAV